MRLHRLEVTAFGPFADTVDVDFDHLSEAGLFLLSGATGAGKTSVLDAVCFALYGDVPGDRGSAKRLRSDQAEPTAVPLVVLEATLGGRRFKIHRSPAWERPKKRGAGTTTEPAHVTVSERVEGEWQPLTSRLDEAGDLIVGLLGMNLTQFTQVAMLPQGRFQAFLRARSDERHRLLQQLFRTGRFERVEQWLRERRLSLGRESGVLHERVADLVSRVSESADVALPDAWDVHDLGTPAGTGELASWVDGLGADAGAAHADAAALAGAAGAQEEDLRLRVERARADGERRRRLAAARAERERLEAVAGAHAEDVVRLREARRAAALVPLRRVAVTAGAIAEVTRRAADDAVAAARHVVGARDLQEAADAAVAGAAAARAAVPRAERLEVVRSRIAEVRRVQQDAVHERADERERNAGLPHRIEGLRADVQAARAAAERADVLSADLADAEARGQAHALIARLVPQVELARGEWLDARMAALDLQEVLVVLQQARIEGMAAEIAGQLAVGADCPVCGSHDHPHKAGARPGAPDAAAEKAARSDVDDARALEHAHDQKVRELETSLAVARERTGGTSPTTAQVRIDELTAERDLAAADGARLSGLEDDLADARARHAALELRLAELAETAARTEAELATLRGEHDQLRRELADVLGGSGRPGARRHDSLESLLEEERATEAVCREALRLVGEADAAEAALAEAGRVLDQAAAEAGFTTAEAALAATLTPSDLDDLAAATSEHERRLAAVAEVLAETDDDLGLDEQVDVEALEAEHARALGEATAARAEERTWASRTERLAGLGGRLTVALDEWAPVRTELEITARLSAFVEGKSPDNLLRMRLSAYVLAYRLSQVVDAANERLARMSDQRYSLEHTGERGAGETRGGLSLVVRDDWSGEARDPATLSGGETFVVSLALALGLADVIAHEAGGAQLDTLFVDEGFGSLDADTLDDVMDTLDSLRDGGRVVGVVSHVAEMRDRIPTQLVVTKARTGSTLSVRR